MYNIKLFLQFQILEKLFTFFPKNLTTKNAITIPKIIETKGLMLHAAGRKPARIAIAAAVIE